MDEFLLLTPDEQRLYYEQAQARIGLPAASIEKDFWVCWTLRELFQLPRWGNFLTFKGGTSLSKAWNLIERFSEDIDIVIDRECLGFAGEEAPEKAPSKKQTRKRLEALREASQRCVAEMIRPLLSEVASKKISERMHWTIKPDPDDPDEQTLLLSYPTVFSEASTYLRQHVKIEMGARSDTDPSLNAEIQAYVEMALPEALTQSTVEVRVVSPKRTFWEKAMLLHEEAFRPSHKKKRKARMARHYYDLYRLVCAGIAGEAVADMDLFHRIVAHREIYFRYTWMDYSTLRPGGLRLLPSGDQLAEWKSDYEAMSSEMFFGDVPEFDHLMRIVSDFEKRFNSSTMA